VNVPYITEENKWTQQAKANYADVVIDKLESFNYVFGSSIRDKIQFIEIFSPQEFNEKYGSEFGSIYGLSSNSLFTLMQRPKNRSSQFKNLFFTGGNTHPGGGVPLCFLSGKIVAELASETN
jgi:phytoene desaturase